MRVCISLSVYIFVLKETVMNDDMLEDWIRTVNVFTFSITSLQGLPKDWLQVTNFVPSKQSPWQPKIPWLFQFPLAKTADIRGYQRKKKQRKEKHHLGKILKKYQVHIQAVICWEIITQ